MKSLELAGIRMVACSAVLASRSFTFAQLSDKYPLPDPAPVPPKQTAITPPATGSLAIRAIQGTPGGPAIAAIPVAIQLLHRGMLLNTINTTLDEHGVVVIDDVPVAMGVQPIASVKHVGLTYQVAGGLMDASHPEQTLEVICYESTEEEPNWIVTMRHVMVAEEPEGLRVSEVIVINNPADRTWIGHAGPSNKRITTAFKLPHGASGIGLGRGFHEWCCTTFAEGALLNHLPLMPDSTEMTFSYLLPAKDGKAEITITAPAPSQHMMLMMAASMHVEAFSGLESAGTQTMGQMAVRSYMVSGMAKNQTASIILAGLTSAPKDVAAGTHMATVGKIIAGIGAGVSLLIALALIVIRKPGRRPRPISIS